MSSWHPGNEPGRQVVVLASALALTAVLLDVMVTGEVTWLFDVAFVLLSAAAAVLVRPRDMFTVGVLPPLVMLAVFLLVGLTDADALAHREDGVAQAVVSGLAHHSLSLCLGYALCLGLLAQRRHVAAATERARTARAPYQPHQPRTVTPAAPVMPVGPQATKRDQSPAPSRTTSG